MLNRTQREAVRLLFEMPEHRVVEELGIMPKTLTRWKGQKEFRAAMQTRSRETQESVERIISESFGHAASKVCELLASQAVTTKADLKVVIEMLKSGGFLQRWGKNTTQVGDLDSVIGRVLGADRAKDRI
jgi:hypothetical protein